MCTFQYNDGGRAAAGYKGTTGDCVTRSIAIITGKPYQEVYDKMNELAKQFHSRKRKVRGKSSARTGMHKKAYHAYLTEELGMTWHPTMQVGQGCKVHLRSSELPSGKLIVQVSRHLTAVIDGVIHDTDNPARESSYIKIEGGVTTRGTSGRCVYGYYSFD